MHLSNSTLISQVVSNVDKWGPNANLSDRPDKKTHFNVHFSCIDFPSIVLFSDPPEVSIELGSKLNAVDIREGDEIKKKYLAQPNSTLMRPGSDDRVDSVLTTNFDL